MFFNLLLVFFAIFTRFWGINWGNGYYFHPDENNMATALTRLSLHNLDPQFYAYGQFPLYLGFFLNLLKTPSFTQAIFILRTISAVSSILAILLVYKISRFHLSQHQARLSALIAIFTPGLIQLAHFGTTESILILLFLFQIYFALKYYRQNKREYVIFSAILFGLALGTKISSAFFCLPIIFAILKSHKYKNLIYYFLISYIFLIISSPFNLINYQDFISSMRYETGVATGQTKVFYTQQFTSSKAYLFQIIKIFPYAFGLPMLILTIVSLFKLKSNYKILLFILLPSLAYFLYFGQLYTKWFRFVSPLFILPALLIPLLFKSKSKQFYFYLFFSLIPALILFTRYFQIDPRVQATNWINQNLPKNSKLLSEGGNVINIPLTNDHNFQVENFDFYQSESSNKHTELINLYATSDYILVPSRRVFANYNTSEFPSIQSYYQNLFSEKKYKLIKTFSPYPSWLRYEQAEETFSVFDSPTIRIYQKI